MDKAFVTRAAGAIPRSSSLALEVLRVLLTCPDDVLLSKGEKALKEILPKVKCWLCRPGLEAVWVRGVVCIFWIWLVVFPFVIVGVVWFGVVWCGVAGCGVVWMWYAVIWCAMLWCGVDMV